MSTVSVKTGGGARRILRVVSIAVIFFGMYLYVGRFRKPVSPVAPPPAAAARPGQETPTKLLLSFVHALNVRDFETVKNLTAPAALPPIDPVIATEWVNARIQTYGPITENDIVRIDHTIAGSTELATILVRMKPGKPGGPPAEVPVHVVKIDGAWFFADRR